MDCSTPGKCQVPYKMGPSQTLGSQLAYGALKLGMQLMISRGGWGRMLFAFVSMWEAQAALCSDGGPQRVRGARDSPKSLPVLVSCLNYGSKQRFLEPRSEADMESCMQRASSPREAAADPSLLSESSSLGL